MAAVDKHDSTGLQHAKLTHAAECISPHSGDGSEPALQGCRRCEAAGGDALEMSADTELRLLEMCGTGVAGAAAGAASGLIACSLLPGCGGRADGCRCRIIADVAVGGGAHASWLRLSHSRLRVFQSHSLRS